MAIPKFFAAIVLLSSVFALRHDFRSSDFGSPHGRELGRDRQILKRHLYADRLRTLRSSSQEPSETKKKRVEEAIDEPRQEANQRLPSSSLGSKRNTTLRPVGNSLEQQTVNGKINQRQVGQQKNSQQSGQVQNQNSQQSGPKKNQTSQQGSQQQSQRSDGTDDPAPLPSFATFQSNGVADKTEFQVTTGCRVTASKTGTLYQLLANPPDCVNLATFLDKALPIGRANFESTSFMTLQHIIIRSVSLDTATSRVDIAAAYTGSVTLIKDILTLSDVSQRFTFNIRGTFSVGSIPINVRLIRDEQGYSFSAQANANISATAIRHMFKQEDTFLPSNSFTSQLKQANFDKFVIINPRLRGAIADGYGFLFAGSVRILEWDPFDINVLINGPNDAPTTVTIAVYTEKFSIQKMFKDLFEIDISDVPVLGTAEVRNVALSLSTGDVETPLTVLEIGSEDIFDIPYLKGLKVSFKIEISSVYVTTSVFISPTIICLTISQNYELELGHVIDAFIPGHSLTETDKNGKKKLKGWPSFMTAVNPLSIALVLFHMEASKTNESWGLTNMKMKLRMNDQITLFDSLIHISNLEFDLNYQKEAGGQSKTSGVVSGRVSLGSTNSESPGVDIRIPFPFANEEISFTFTDFTVRSIVEAVAGKGKYPSDFPELFDHIKLDKVAIKFNDQGKVDAILVDASIPGLWDIFGEFSIGNVKILFEYGVPTTTTSSNPNSRSSGRPAPAPQKDLCIEVKGDIVIASCTITITAVLSASLVEIRAAGNFCSASVSDLLKKIHLNGEILPPIISGFTIFNPKLEFKWQRGQNGAKAIAFTATTSLFYQSEVELALISSGGKSAVVAGFAVDVDAISEISFLKSLSLSNVAIVYVSQRLAITPYEFLNPIFKHYITTTPESSGITIYARFVPKEDNLLGKLLRKGIDKDVNLKPKTASEEPEVILKISFPALIAELEVKIPGGIELIPNSGWKFTSMKLIVSKRLIGLSLKCRVHMDSSKDGEAAYSTFEGDLTLSFTGTVTISFLWEGNWNNPFGISRHLTITRMGLALGINVASLVPSFGITGGITVDIPKKSPISVNLTLCIDPTSPDQTVFELHFTRLLLQDIISLFSTDPITLPHKLGEMGFPDEVQIYFSPAGNPACFGKRYDAGLEVHGTLQIPFLSIRARIDLSVKFTPFALTANLTLDPINYLNGVIKIVDAYSNSKGAHLFMHITNDISALKIDGSCRVEIFGAMISVRLQINSKKFFFDGRLNLWNLFQVHIVVDISIENASPNVHVLGEMQNDLFAKLKQKASQGIQSGARAINANIEAAQQKILNAKREVNKLQDYIEYHQRKINEARHECSRAPWYKKYICIGTGFKIAYHGTVLAGLWVAHKAAIGVLEAARYFLKGVSAVIKVGADVLQRLVNAALSIIDIQYVKFEVSMTGVRKRFDFIARIVVLGWTFTPHFSIDFSSSCSANRDIGSAGNSISESTLKQVKR